MNPSQISHYELRRRLGRGGMGEVYEAFDLKAKRTVALKFVAPELASDPAVFKRFETEAVNAAAMNHPNIATLFEFEPEGERPFIAMELVAGPSLRARIAAGPLPVQESLEVARDVAAALAYAHRRQIVHRDIKPENLMFDEEGRIKVMDFGLARALLASRLTMTGSTLGTPAYMSPESVQQGSGGPESDVFALGLVLYEMLSGHQVFQAETPMAVMFAIAKTEAQPLRTQRPDAPEALESLVARVLDKAPERRPDAATLARELAELSGTRVSQLVLGAGEAATAAAVSAPTLAMSTPAAGASAVSAPTVAMSIPGAASVSAPTVAMPGAPERAHAATSAASPRAWRKAPLVISVLGAIAIVAAGGLWMTRTSATRAARRQEAVTLNNQAFAAMERAQLDSARVLVDRALERSPDYGEALFSQARIYHYRGQTDSAAALYAALLRSHANDDRLAAAAYFNLGDLDLDAGAPEQAAEKLTQSFRRDSTRWETFSNLGYALIEAGRPAEALALLERGIARFPGAAPLYKNAALALVSLDREPEAMIQLERALARDSRLASARGLRARLRARSGDLEGALADWNLYLASGPAPNSPEFAAIAREMLERGVVKGLPSP